MATARTGRHPARGAHGAVSAGHELAARTALRILEAGGGAVDAAIAGSAVQCVVEAPWCGIGGDAFVAVRTAVSGVRVVNGSGAAPARIAGALGAGGQAPRFGPLSVAVPGIVSTWAALHESHGSLPLADLLADAVDVAADGIVVDERLSRALTALSAGPHVDFAVALAPDGHRPGDLLRQPDLAATLAGVGRHGERWFYEGPIARRIADHLATRGGVLDATDLAEHRATWGDALAVAYRGHVVHTQPPVSMGPVLLAEMALLDRLGPVGPDPVDPADIDLMVRCRHAAFAEVLPHLADPSTLHGVDSGSLVDPGRWDDVAERVRLGLASPAVPSRLLPAGTDTTSLAVTDASGTVVSLVQSLFNEFGSRELVPGTGIVLNDRLANLRVDGSAAGLAGGKRPTHTLHSYVVERADGGVVAGATPGGRGQVQTNFQVLVGLLDHDVDVQAAVDRPRWVSGTPRRSPPDDTLYVETGLAAAADELRRLGHPVEVRPAGSDDHFGCCSVVAVDATAAAGRSGTHTAAADDRRGAVALARTVQEDT